MIPDVLYDGIENTKAKAIGLNGIHKASPATNSIPGQSIIDSGRSRFSTVILADGFMQDHGKAPPSMSRTRTAGSQSTTNLSAISLALAGRKILIMNL